MPMDKKLYPSNWGQIALGIKTAADWICLECGRPCRRPGESDGDLIERLFEAGWASVWTSQDLTELSDSTDWMRLGRFTLTVAHLNHIPSDCRPENLRALCSVCHCRYDLAQMELKKRLKKERLGQLTIPVRD